MSRGRVFVLAAVLACVAVAWSCATRAHAALLPDPGGTGAWGAGLALLADPAGPLALFDQPARLGVRGDGDGEGARRLALGASHARWFELDDFARVRVAARFAAPHLALAVGAERFGPAEARLARTSAACAVRVLGLDSGAAWHEAHGAGALDLGVASAPAGASSGSLSFALAARAVASGGDPRARPEPDWTLEAAWRRGDARVHAALTRDLVSTRAGGGLVLQTNGLRLGAGAFGAPWTWTLAVSWGGGALFGGYARAVHPTLGVCEQGEMSLAW